MDDMILRSRLSRPLVTGTPGIDQQKQPQQGTQAPAESFDKVLQKQLQSRQSLSFSKHAAARIEERNIDISEGSMERLQQGMTLAQQKGLDDTLIIVDQTAFVVNAKNSTIITALSGNDLQGNVFTNITGTVII